MNEIAMIMTPTAFGCGFWIAWHLRSRKADRQAAVLDDLLGEERGATAEAVDIIEAHAKLMEGLADAAFPEGHNGVKIQRLVERVKHLGLHFHREVAKSAVKLVDRRQKRKRKKQFTRKIKRRGRLRAA